MNPESKQSGYVALLSAILITVLLVAFATHAGLNSFLLQFDALHAEAKEESMALAKGCLEYFRLHAILGHSLSGEMVVMDPLSQNSCTILDSQQDHPSQGQWLVVTKATVRQSHTVLQSVVASDGSLLSLQECPTDSC